MSNNIFEGLEVLEVYIENSNQKVFLCEDKKLKDLYMINVITNKRIVEGINEEELPNILDSFITYMNREEGLYIVTRYKEGQPLKEYVSDHRMNLSKQVSFTTLIMDKLSRLKNYPSFIVYSLLNMNNIFVNNEGKLSLLDLIIVDDNHINIGKSKIFEQLAHILHIIFSGTELTGEYVSDDMPPDIIRIINNCLESDYIKYEDFINDFKTSKIYRLINPEMEESMRVHKMRKNLHRRRIFINIKKKALLIAMILIIILPIAIYSIGRLFPKDNIDTVDQGDTTTDSTTDDYDNGDDPSQRDEEDIDEEETTNPDDTQKDESGQKEAADYYYNEELIKGSGAENIGIIDDSKFYEGNASVKIVNDQGKRMDFLVSRIDLKDESFNFLQSRKIDVSMRLISSLETEAVIFLRVTRDGKLLSEASRKVSIRDDLWTLYTMNIETGNGDLIDIYITTSNQSVIWADSFSFDILK